MNYSRRSTSRSLPRAQQIIHARQNIFDGTWDKTPSMGWMFVPLVEYHGGGAAAKDARFLKADRGTFALAKRK